MKTVFKISLMFFVSMLFIIPPNSLNAQEQGQSKTPDKRYSELENGKSPQVFSSEKKQKQLEVGDVNVVPLQVTGPVKDRLNLIIFGDGYTPDEMDKFHEDVDRNLNVQWAAEPFRSYRNYFNVYMVETPSKDSGISYDPDDGNVHRDTPLNLQFGGDEPSDKLERLITFGPGGTKKRKEIMKNYVAPKIGISEDAQNVQSLTLANTFTYGGAGGTTATTSGGSPQGPLISLHELGHSLGGLQDDYPYYNRDEPGGRAPNKEPNSIHLTRMSSKEMTKNNAKWWRWLGEKSTAGGIIRAADPDGHESGGYYQSNIWRPSEHSKMRWIGFPFDQVEREQMVHRISGLRDANEMPLRSTPEGEVGSDDVLWVDTTHPRFHELNVTWKINGKKVPKTHNNQHLKLADLDVKQGDIINVKVQDPTDFVRKTSLKQGPSMTQTRKWTIGESLSKNKVDVEFTNHSPTEYPLAKDEVVYVETPHPTDHVMKVTWKLNGKKVSNKHDSFNFDLDELNLPQGSSELSATLTDPDGSSDKTDTIKWTIDNGIPEAPKKLSKPLTKKTSGNKHNIYFNKFGMQLEPEDDQEGYVVGKFQLDGDGWYNYYGFPEKPLGSPYIFSHSGTDIKALTYGNLGTGGLSKAAFEQDYTKEDPGGPFVPGFGTHTVEHRAIDASGNIGNVDKFEATVLPGDLPESTKTITGDHDDGLVISEGVTHLKDAHVTGGIKVKKGASLVVRDSSIYGGFRSEKAKQVQVFGSTVNGYSRIHGTTKDVTIAGSTFKNGLTLLDNNQVSANEQFGEYGPILAGSSVYGPLASHGNSSKISSFGASNEVNGTKTGPNKDMNTKSIKTLIEQLNGKGDFANSKVIHSLKLHLNAVNHYEKKNADKKVVKQMNSFKQLLNHQQNEDLISTRVYDNLKISAEVMIKEWNK